VWKWLAKNTVDRQTDRQTERISVANALRFAFNGGICYLEKYLASSSATHRRKPSAYVLFITISAKATCLVYYPLLTKQWTAV
jgi:ammonia channel protein AmtB